MDQSRLIVIDTETSGTNPLRHELLSAAFVPLTADVPPLVVYIRHENIEWTSFAKANFEQFRAEWERFSIPPDCAVMEVESYFRKWFGGQTVTPVGHNIGFDLSFLKRLAYQSGKDAISHVGHRAVDTHTLLYLLFLTQRIPLSATTSDGAFDYFRIAMPARERHTAIGDAKATRVLFEHLLAEFGVLALEDSRRRYPY